MSTGKGGIFQVLKIVFLRLRFIFLFVVIGVVSWKWELIMNTVDKVTRPKQAKDLVQGEYEWYCPMHPTIIRADDKQKCPICGMPLSRRKKGEQVQLPPGIVAHLQLSPFRIRQAGVATEEIGYRTLIRELRTVGLIDWDERRISRITARFAGRADELAVNFTGIRVRKGDPLYKVYSPDLSATQEEYLLALKSYEELNGTGAPHDDAADRARRLIESTRQRMRLWGITDDQIQALEKSKKVETYVTVESPASGIVIKKDVAAGQQLMMGDTPYTVVDDSAVWMQAEVFERDMALVKAGRTVEITAEAFPGESFMGKVSFVSPQIDPSTRTVKVRVDVENPQSRLKQGMYVTAVLRIPVGSVGEIYYGCCEACPDVHEDKPGKCVKCAMELVKKGGVRADAEESDLLKKVQESKDSKAPANPKTAPESAPAKPEGKGPDPKAEGKALYLCGMDGGTRETPGPCPKCKMDLGESDRVPAGKDAKGAPPKEHVHVHEEKKKEVPDLGDLFPKKESQAKDEKAKAGSDPAPAKAPPTPEPPKADAQAPEMKPEPQKPQGAPRTDDKGPKEFVYKCPMDGAVRDTPGPCPKCKMPLGEAHKIPKPQPERTIYVCDVHPEEVFDKPGQCFKESCNGMVLEPRKIVPGAKLIYVCPAHPEVKSDQPGLCPKEKCGKKLGFKVVSQATQLSETWACMLHPDQTAGGKLQCPECGREMKHLEVEQVLAVPFSAVVDTGIRKVVFVDKGHGTFDATEIEVGPRAGEYYPLIKGLAAGDRVVTAGAFLLDAETRLNPAAGVIYFGASGQSGGGEKK
jgi:RND family efflux transporter MFP subunit